MDPVPDAGVCSSCGSSLAPDGTCGVCGRHRSRPRTLSGDAGVLAILSGIAVLLFLVTSVAVNSYRAKERQLGKEWAEKGHTFLRASQPARAIEAFQTSLRYEPAAPEVRYALVDSLLAAGRSEQARSYLLSLWERQPANGTINLELARIAARRRDLTATTRYYHNAIYGVWDSDAQEQRTRARLELVRFLLERNAEKEADAELVALAANAPPSPQLSLEIGRGFLAAGDHDRAFEQFTSALKSSPQDPELLAGAGHAAFAQGRYEAAYDYLEKARQQNHKDPETERLLELARLIRENDPFDRGVPWPTRSNRAVAALGHAEERLRGCDAQFADSAPAEVTRQLNLLADARKHASIATIRRDPDLLIRYATLAFWSEELAARYCGPPAGLDEALLLIGRRHPETRP